MFTKNLSLFFPLLFLLHTFLNLNVVTAVSLQFQRRSLNLDLGALNTNAKRLTAGAPPISPTKRWVPSKVARDPQTSAVPVTRVIRVELDNNAHTLIGYVSQDLDNGHYFLAPLANAGQFSTTIKPSGDTVDINLKVQNSGLFLAGIVQSGLNLRNNNAAFARIGQSQSTNPNDTPQSGKSPSLPGDAETAIWSYSADQQRLRVQWVNYNNGKATNLMYDDSANTFYITNDPDGVAQAHPTAVVVKFFFV